MDDIGQDADDEIGTAAEVRDQEGAAATLRRLQPGNQRVLLRPSPPRLRPNTQLLQVSICFLTCRQTSLKNFFILFFSSFDKQNTVLQKS